jgi:segregation and condensation protein B
MGMPLDELVAALEAVLYVSAEPVTLPLLSEVFPDEDDATLAAGLEALARQFEQPGRGLLLDRVAGGWRIATRPEVHPHVARVVQRERAERLSLRTLETLSVVAYKQPVTATEISEIRGVDVSGTVRTLLDRGLVRVAGRKRVVGRPFVYGTTRKFLETFGLNALDELPTLKELEELVTDVPTTDPSEVDHEGADGGDGHAADATEAAAPMEPPDLAPTRAAAPARSRSRRERAGADDDA